MHTKTSDEAADEASAHSMATSVSADVPTPTIRLLTVERFRGIQSLTWRPSIGLNVVLGGGDVGKTTILDAIALLLSPQLFRKFVRCGLLCAPHHGRVHGRGRHRPATGERHRPPIQAFMALGVEWYRRRRSRSQR